MFIRYIKRIYLVQQITVGRTWPTDRTLFF